MVWLILLLTILGLALVLVLLWWLLIKTEGVYLGRGTVIWLYNVYATRYDTIKQFDPENEDYFLARPILQRLLHVRAPLLLDVATGTGRVPLALLEQPSFQGRIIALDLSRKMLTIAAQKLAPYQSRVALLHQPAEKLPFPDNTFDCVTCLEALEFMMRPKSVIHELVRVLRPGGLLVLTNRQGTDAKLMPGKTFAHTALKRYLRNDLELSGVQVQAWQLDYRLVWATKPGQSTPPGPLPLDAVWCCPRCGQLAMQSHDDTWHCGQCGTIVRCGQDGVIENSRAS